MKNLENQIVRFLLQYFLFSGLQDTYYDIVDALESQGLEDAMKKMMSLGNKELMDQCKLYERVLKLEDEADSNDDSSIVKMRLEIPYQKFS